MIQTEYANYTTHVLRVLEGEKSKYLAQRLIVLDLPIDDQFHVAQL